MSIPYPFGTQRIGSARTATPRIIFRSGTMVTVKTAGAFIDGVYSRDTGNTGNLDVLRAGTLMGKITSSGYWANSIIGLSNAAYTSGTTLTLTAVAVTELNRRIGASGTFKIVGPSTANGVVNEETVTYSALPTSTTATITALSNDYISGSLILPNDGSEYPRTFIPDGWGQKVTDLDAANTYVDFPELPIMGEVISANIIYWPSDTGLRDWIVGMMEAQGFGKWVFDYKFS